MKRLLELKEKLLNFPSKVPEFMGEVLRENTAFIEDKNAEQLNQGLRGDGSVITPPYAALTKQIKSLKGQPIDRVTLKDEGNFHKGIKAEIGNDSISMFGQDEKTTILEQKYGVEIIGLTESNVVELGQEVVKPELQVKTRKYFDV
jgi:hypothetical protein